MGEHAFDFGLDNEVLVRGVKITRCLDCGESSVGIHRLLDLHDAIAGAVARRPGSLTPREVAFLRKHMELSQTEFGEMLGGIRQETVSRWESMENPQPMGRPVELLLRILVIDHINGIQREFQSESKDTGQKKFEAFDDNGHWSVAA